MKKQWKQFAAAGLITAALTMTACSPSGGDGSDLQEVRVSEVIRSIFYAPQYVAIEKGYFKEEGLNVLLDTAWGGDKAMTRLLADQTDVALIGAETTVYVQQQGAADPVVNFAQVTQRDGSFVIARNKIDNWDWSMLKGKSLIGSRKGSMPEMVSEYVQKQNGLQPFTDVNIIQNISFDNQATAFASGTGDFLQAFEPSGAILEKAGQGHVVASFGEDSGKLPYTVFMAKASTIKSEPETFQKFTNAVQKAQNFVHSSTPEEVAKVILPYFEGVDPEIVAAVVKRYQESDGWAKDPVIDQEEFDNMKKIMKDAGELKADVKYEDLVNTTFAEKAQAN
ncbi:ABC transporter substrate-binding protein [Tumebacillus avium]|nr:ABC transporter substrate-binding protein [Tumebacillus avium]